MTKHEFLAVLSEGLKNLSQTERKEILYDYEEHFRIGESNNKCDEEIISELGDPHMILSQYKSSYDENPFKQVSSKDYSNDHSNLDRKYYSNSHYNESYQGSNTSTITKVIVTILIIIAVIPVGSAVLSILLGLYATALGLLVGGIGIIIGGLTGGLALSIISLSVSVPLSALVFIGIGTIALGLLLFMFSIWLTKLGYDLIVKLINWIKEKLV
jgi:uncharacterized membrane protein